VPRWPRAGVYRDRVVLVGLPWPETLIALLPLLFGVFLIWAGLRLVAARPYRRLTEGS
jgi:hypothetical protein